MSVQPATVMRSCARKSIQDNSMLFPVDLASVERVEINLMKPTIAACSFDVIPKSLLTDGTMFGKPVAAIV